MFATSMKAKWASRVYIDLFTGAGRGRIKDTSPSYMDANRNVASYVAPGSTAIQDFLKNSAWRSAWSRTRGEFGSFVVDQLGQSMKRLGFLYDGPGEEVVIQPARQERSGSIIWPSTAGATVGWSSGGRPGEAQLARWVCSSSSAMPQLSQIEWTDATWNPVTGCMKISPGCKFCYAERMAGRLHAMRQHRYRNAVRSTLQPDLLEAPLHWSRPRVIFVNSMSDLFHEDVRWGSASRIRTTRLGCATSSAFPPASGSSRWSRSSVR